MKQKERYNGSSILVLRQKALIKPLWTTLLIAVFTLTATSQESVFDRKISLPEQRTTLYQALNQISDSIGYFFIYDSKVVNNEKRIKVSANNLKLSIVLNNLLSDSSLSFKNIGQHILIYQPSALADTTTNRPTDYMIIRGQVFDSQTKEPIPYATVGIMVLSIGNVTNRDGLFVLKVPKSQSNNYITVSHIGYKSKQLPLEVMGNEKVDFFLEVEHISIQEVIIRNVNPQSLIQEAVMRFSDNYIDQPAYLTTFYREGVKKDDKFINYSEAVFKVYKSAYSGRIESDQMKLLKSRKIQNVNQNDTLIIKLKGGLSSSLALDIIKNSPSFLDPETFSSYNYYKYDITTIGDRSSYAIEFVQKETVYEPLLKGVVYIDMETLAILGANFQVNPEYVEKTADQLVVKRTRKYSIRPTSVSYTVNYQQINGRYYLSHVRGDLKFKYKKRRQLFYSNFDTFMEMAASNIDTLDVKRFDRKETERTTEVFSDLTHDYDENFWLEFNHIAPEENLYESLLKMSTRIEQIIPKE